MRPKKTQIPNIGLSEEDRKGVTGILSKLLFIAVLSTAAIVTSSQEANALITRDYTYLNDNHLTALYGNTIVCGDHMCAPGEWNKLQASITASQLGHQGGRITVATTPTTMPTGTSGPTTQNSTQGQNVPQQTTQENNIMNTRDYYGIQPEARALLESFPTGDPQIIKLSVKDARIALSNAQAGVNVTKLPADIKDLTIPVGPKGSVDIRIIRPVGNNETLPVVMYFHGGGWALGDKNTHDRLVREIANGAKAAVVFVNYDRSPEAQYPVAIEEAYAATKWVADNANTINVDPSRIAVAGDSAGGNMATVVTMLAKERGGPNIIYQVLFYPVTDAKFDTASYLQFQNGYWLTLDGMKWFLNLYAPDHTVWTNPHVFPLEASIDQLKGLPSALVITGENDVLRDEGEAYAHKLTEAGVNVTATRYLGTIHDFLMLNAVADDPAPRAAIKQANDMLLQTFAK